MSDRKTAEDRHAKAAEPVAENLDRRPAAARLTRDESGRRLQGQWRHTDGRGGTYIEYYREPPSSTSTGRAAIWLESMIDGYPVALVLIGPPQSGDTYELLRLVVKDHAYELT